MTNEERKALVDEMRELANAFGDDVQRRYSQDMLRAGADQIEADGQRIAELEAILADRERKSENERNRIAELEAALREIMELDGEINPSNYNHDDACYLNDQFCSAFSIVRAALTKRGLEIGKEQAGD